MQERFIRKGAQRKQGNLIIEKRIIDKIPPNAKRKHDQIFRSCKKLIQISFLNIFIR